MDKFTRRQSLILGAGAVSLITPFGRAAWAAIPTVDATPPKADIEKGAALRVLRPAKFLAGDEIAFNENAKKFTELTGVEVKVDYQAWEDLRPQTAVTANTGAGPDIVIGWADDPHLYADKLIEVSDIAEYLGKKYGGWFPTAQKFGKRYGTENWIALPMGGSGAPAVYRQSWMQEAGFDKFPRDLDGFLKLAQGLKKLKHPPGFAVGHALGDANSFCYWLIWSHGAFMTDEKGKLSINSKETVEALKYGKALYENFISGTQAWQDSSNNKAFIAGDIGLTQNGVSIYKSFRNSQDPKIVALADDVYNARMPIGPVGIPTETALIINSMIFKHTKYPNAARAFMIFMMEAEQYDKWLIGCSGYWAHPLKAYDASTVWSEDPKVGVYRDTIRSSLWYGARGPINEASAAVVADYVTVDMVGAVCSGSSTPAEAAAEAERRAKRYYKS